ncbi:acyltransferase [Salipiger pacificus]|nr:acyltransferase [Alloyangia pacifica]
MAREEVHVLRQWSPTIADRAAGRDNNFNLLRMLAAIGVLISHAYPISLGTGAEEPLAAVLRGWSLGTLCVMTFFAISGFFIARSFTTKASVSDFLRARALRIFPALAVVLGLTVLAGAGLTHAPAGIYLGAAPGYVLHNMSLFFLNYELPGVFEANPYGPAINGSLWTLNYEVLCYLGVIFCGLLGLLARPRLFVLGVACVGACWTVTAASDLHPRLPALASLALPFSAGMGLWVWREKIPLSPWLAAIGAGIAAMSWSTSFFHPLLGVAWSYAVFVLGYARLPRLQAYNRLGDYSYGTYLYAFPVQQVLAWTGIMLPLWNMALALPATLMLAALSWHLVESPALKWKGGASRGLATAG